MNIRETILGKWIVKHFNKDENRFVKWLNKDNVQLIHNYLELRKTIGILGMALPFLLVIGCAATGGCGIRSSISAYYYTNMRNVFVGILCTTGLFLFTYKGYKTFENILSSIGAVFAVTTAMFPCSPDLCVPCPYKSYDHVHFVSALIFFIVLITFSFLFTKSDQKREERPVMKKRRNRIYRSCGFTMIGSILGIAVTDKFLPGLKNYNPEFWLETTALLAFGISWYVKGKTYAKVESKHYGANQGLKKTEI